MIKAILFDADGVLIHSKDEYFSENYAKKNDLDRSIISDFFENEFQKCLVGDKDLKQELEILLPKLNLDIDSAELMDTWFEYENEINNAILNIAINIQNHDIKILVGTNNEKYRTDYMRKVLKFDKIFDKVYGSADIGYKKPDKKFFEFILEKENLEPEEVIYIDDDKKNVESGKEMGIKSYHFGNTRDMRKFIRQELK